MPEVKIQIVRFTHDRQPGFVECQLVDITGRARLFEEKGPVVSSEYLDADSTHRCEGSMGCTLLARTTDGARIGVDALVEYFECVVPESSIVGPSTTSK